MESSVKTLARSLLTAVLAVAWLALADVARADHGPAGTQQKATAGQAPATSTEAQPTGGYAGEQRCLSCHEDQAKSYHETVHGRAWNADSPMANQGCEGCHGPGQGHVDDSGDKSKIKTLKTGMRAREISAQCLNCHAAGERAIWEGSQHDSRNMSCVTCHSIHGPASEAGLLKAVQQVETCERCHRAQVQKLHRSAHMPVHEGKLECSSCHNPHGSTNTKLLKVGNTVNDACESCHAEKRGPYLWEHSPVVQECTTCHDAHGSTNDRMLVAKEPMLCQRCHVTAQHPATVYDGYALANSTSANRVYGRSCAACHQNIHGSNAPSGKAFLR